LICLPENWSNKEFELIDLKTYDSSLYKRIKANFLKSIEIHNCQVISIERIQNPDLYFHFRA